MEKQTKKRGGKREGAGRPKIQFDVKKVEQLAMTCDSKTEIARILGISMDTLSRREKESAEFADAIKTGRAKANAFVGGKLMELIKQGNVAATIFYMKARCGWLEVNRTELSGVDGKPIKTEQMGTLSNAELLAIAGMKTDEGDKGTSTSGKKGVKAKGG